MRAAKSFFLILIFIFVICSLSYPGRQTEPSKRKIDGIRLAIQKGILSIYDIPFTTYINLGMWHEIDFILKANNDNIKKYGFPGKYYSRPHMIYDKIWIFKNSGKNLIYIFNPDTLSIEKTITNALFFEFEGGIKLFHDGRLIAGGSDTGVDSAILWNLNKDVIRTVTLTQGHYINSFGIDNETLYIGSCGGIINSFGLDDLLVKKIYFTSKKKNTNWRIFNGKECISRIHFFNEMLIGAGNRHIFLWKFGEKYPIRKWRKKIPGSFVNFYGKYIIEYKDNEIVVRDINTGNITGKVKTDAPIDDLVVTDENIIAKHVENPLILICYRYNKGIGLIDFNSFELIKKFNFKGEMLCVHKGRIFATDDKNLYRYDIRYNSPKEYEKFLKTLDINKINMDWNTYKAICQRADKYPKIIDPKIITAKFLKKNGIVMSYSYRYGIIKGNTDNPGEMKKIVYGYKLRYKIKNDSENHLKLNFIFKWSGEYGRRKQDNNDKISVKKEMVELPPPGKIIVKEFVVGEKEPLNLYFFVDGINEL